MYDSVPCLDAALPALEKLYHAWETRSKRKKYSLFTSGLDAAMGKIDDYYNKTATSHAYTFVMSKSRYFNMGWCLLMFI